MSEVTLLPSSVLAALDAEADLWVYETSLDEMIENMVQGDLARQKLMDFAKLCFVEGAYRGALNVINGKSLAESIEAADRMNEGARDA